MSSLNNAINDRYPKGYINGLRLVYASSSTLTLVTGHARDSTDAINIDLTTNATLSTATSGAVNGLDTGSIAASSIYAVYAITGSAGQGSLASLSYTSPSLPSGYSQFRYVGSFATDSSKNIFSFFMVTTSNTRYVLYDTPLANITAVSAGTATSFTGASCSLFMPITSTMAILNVLYTSGGADTDTLSLRQTGSSTTTPVTTYASGTATVQDFQVFQSTNTSQSFDYKTTSASDSVTIYLAGYIDNV
jgi:hypothetical protein